MSAQTLLPILEKMSDSRILVIGDIMLDGFIYGNVDRISPESPVPVLNVKREELMLGGAGNTLSNIAGLRANADIIALIGEDENAAKIKTHIEKIGYSADHLIKDQNRPTTVKNRYLAGHQQLLRTDFEDSRPISEKEERAILEKAKELIPDCGAVILSDYGKGMLTPALIAALIEETKHHNIPVIVDPKGKDFSIYKDASAITPNKKELSEAAGNHAVETDEEIVSAATHLIETCGIESIIATRSGDGISIIEKDKKPTHIAGADIEVFDVSGAGDCVIASIAAAIATGASLTEAAALANIAGSIVVTKVGTAPIRLEELKAALENETDPLFNIGKDRRNAERAKRGDILSWEEAAETVRRWKAKGLKVGFTNGCFDILHFGHVTYLNDASDHCDRLIMGLNKDSSIRVLKGPERPVHNEQSRAAVIAALGSIDMVVLFGAEKEGDDNTACALLGTLKPDVYFKGGDYTIDQIPEAPTVMQNGGEVKVMPVYEGHSTTNSIKKIKAGEKKDAA